MVKEMVLSAIGFWQYLLLIALLLPSQLLAAQTAVTSDDSVTTATIEGTLRRVGETAPAALFADDQQLELAFDIVPDAPDMGTTAELFQVARYQDQWFMRSGSGSFSWLPWDGVLTNLEPFASRQLTASENVRVLDGRRLPPGEYSVYAGYRSTARARIVYNARPLTFAVVAAEQPRPLRFRSKSMLENYMLEATSRGVEEDPYRYYPLAFAMAATSGGADTGGTSFSTTNLQERGVDEADSVKTDGRYVYALARCDNNRWACIDIYQITESPASNNQIDRLVVAGETQLEGLYLLDQDQDATMDTLLAIGVRGGYTPYWNWPGSWGGAQTQVYFYDLPQPTRPRLGHELEFDGGLVSSRVVAGQLHLATRFSPAFWDLPELPQLHGAGSVTIQNQLLPKLTIDGAEVDLLQAERCFMPPYDLVNDLPEASSVTLTAMPLNDPASFQTTSVMGASETLYASTAAIYLATSGYTAPSPLDGSYQASTNLHKFRLGEGAPEYRGSASVRGHLGYEADKKPFRMGEYQDVLRVATSVGEQWNGTASTSVALLSESGDGLNLVQRGRLDKLGKPNERLYSARFIGERGYLVTFLKVDPLYVLDLSDPDQPQVAGELEVEGYSDYLHPLNEQYLLGVGKHAVPAETEGDGGRLAFAWYQGVKLSLFDVSDPATPKEVDKIIIGKRGTNSPVLWDHLALAHVPALPDAPDRVAIPISVHATIPASVASETSAPSYTYDWTHTSLYVFDVHTGVSPSIEPASTLPAGNATGSWSSDYPERSILLGGSSHFLHNGALFSGATPRPEKR